MATKSIYSRPNIEQRRVVVTGMGAVTPLGTTWTESWDKIVAGQSGVDQIKSFQPDGLDVTIAGEVQDFNAENYIPKKDLKKMDRFIQLSMASTQMALEQSGFEVTPEKADRFGALIGVGIGGLPVIEKQQEILLNRGPSRISPFFIPSVITNLAAGQVSIRHGAKGPNYAISSACASGAHAIGEAAHYIRRGQCDVMIAGGAEATVSPLAIAGFASMKALSNRNSDPTQASRPWDRDRNGFVLSEGAAILILEDYEHAARRGANIFCELSGYGVSSDAHHMTNPAPSGEGAARAMAWALKDAKLNPSDIGYINAHGTSTLVGDELETQAIKSVFTDHAKDLWVSSTKSMTGHTLGAAGAIESVFSILSLCRSIAPPTINLENPSPDCDLDYVAQTAREKSFQHVMNNSFGFGGTNACLTFSKISDED